MPAGPQNWSEFVSNAKSATRQPGDSAPPEAVSRIVAAAAQQRRQWILDAWKCFTVRAIAIALLAIAAAALTYWLRHQPAPEPTIIPLPILEKFPDAPIAP